MGISWSLISFFGSVLSRGCIIVSLHGASLEFILVSEDLIYVDSWLLIISSVQWWETGVVWWGWSVVWCDILPLEWNIHLLQTLQFPHQFFIMPAKKKKEFLQWNMFTLIIIFIFYILFAFDPKSMSLTWEEEFSARWTYLKCIPSSSQ